MHRETLTVGFSDLTNFARLVSAAGDEQAAAALQTCLEAAGEIITRHGGRIRKYIGDAVLFTFPAPGPAAQAARELGKFRQTAAGLELRYYTGMATGEVVVTSLGHASYVVEDILGQTINRAAMLLKEARQHAGGLAMDDATRAAVK